MFVEMKRKETINEIPLIEKNNSVIKMNAIGGEKNIAACIYLYV